MTNFFDELCESVGIENQVIKGSFKIIALSFNAIVIEGHKGIIWFSNSEMNFKVKGGNVKISGDNLNLKNFSKYSAAVKGVITKVEFVQNGKI